MVRDLLEKEFGEAAVAKGGLEVTTSLDWSMQNKAQASVQTELEKVKDLNITNGAAIAMNPKTGEDVLEMIGSVDYNSTTIDGKFNVAVDGLRQPGSSIKPVTYSQECSAKDLHRSHLGRTLPNDVPA